MKSYNYKQKSIVQDHKDYSDKSHLFKSKNDNYKSKEMSDMLLGFNPNIDPKGKTIRKDDLTNSRII